MTRPEPRVDRIALAILLSVAAVLACDYFLEVDVPEHDRRLELHRSIVEGTAPEPFRHRILVPLAAEGALRLLAPVTGERWAFLLAYAAHDTVALSLLLVGLFLFLGLWFTRQAALLGALFVAATLATPLRDHYFQPWSLLEAALFPVGLLLIVQRRTGALAAVVLLASLNRETGLFLALAHLLARPRQEWRGRPLAVSLSLLALSAAVHEGLRVVLGRGPAVLSVAEVQAINLMPGNLARTALQTALFLGVFWWLAVRGHRGAPPELRRLARWVPFYAVVVLVFGIHHEVRLWMPVYPVAVALALHGLVARGWLPAAGDATAGET